MPSKHRYPAITPRPEPDLKRRAQDAVARMGTDLNAYVIACLRYLVGDINEMPQRPEPMCTDDGQQSTAS